MKLRAMVFDDNPVIRSALGELLNKFGYEVFSFPEPGFCPLQEYNECPCGIDEQCTDFIISDIEMPGMNGIDFVIEQLGKGCRVRHIALMSGNWSTSDLKKAAELGCKTFTKPFDIDEFMHWLKDCQSRIDVNRKLRTLFV
jgi:CheY-like chemotaxis protein